MRYKKERKKERKKEKKKLLKMCKCPCYYKYGM